MTYKDRLSDHIKETIRRLLFPTAWLFGPEFVAREGSLKQKFLTWLYGEDESYPIHDGWFYPDDDGDAK